ncbi:hypothetical protein [Flagellimonas aequoris]|uniref:Uncharacterized protein n=1 Tax=Flagellimonas aequoris TaxID=2306997 RepID=A0A418N4E7_9FLAO|nr:hypothetical protein [Allomuricauda aequoris]RIV68767.1 hypothetical protein D2U88_16420 [Allomuricauda aequoris]TXK00467.1 hypothetical protein FQ019_16230 [Allomuricauda aequoris]
MNRYIKAMEIGLAHEKEGISYFELLNQIEAQLGYEFSLGAESSFFEWFIDNFSSGIGKLNMSHFKRDILRYLEDKEINDIDPEFGKYKALMAILNKPYRLDGHAAKQYLDYQELVESRQMAQDAREASREANRKASKSIRLAVWAIVVSAAVGLFSIIIDLVAFSKSPVPPYDVKIMEDKTRTQQLEKENGQLKEELYRAEMMLETQVSDSISN